MHLTAVRVSVELRDHHPWSYRPLSLLILDLVSGPRQKNLSKNPFVQDPCVHLTAVRVSVELRDRRPGSPRPLTQLILDLLHPLH